MSRLITTSIGSLAMLALVGCATMPPDMPQARSGESQPGVSQAPSREGSRDSLGAVGLLSTPLPPLPNQANHERQGVFDGYGTCAAGFAASILFWAGAVYVCPWFVAIGNLVDRPPLPDSKDSASLEAAFSGALPERKLHDRLLVHARAAANTNLIDLGTVDATARAKGAEGNLRAEKSVQTTLEVGLLPLALTTGGGKNDPHVDMWIAARARLIRVSDRQVLADEQLEVSISFAKLSDSEANDQALLVSRIEKIDAELDTLAANIVSRVLFLERLSRFEQSISKGGSNGENY